MYLRLLARHSRRWPVRIVGYCLMGNHVHLIAIPDNETSLSRCLGRTHVDYARWLNLRRGETGHVWQNRFFSCAMQQDHQWAALRYVESNPVRAGLVDHASDWPWSSAAAHTGGTDRSHLLDTAEWSLTWTVAGWRQALIGGIDDGAHWERIRAATRTGRPAGADDFVKRLELDRKRPLRLRKRGPRVRAAAKTPPLSLDLGVS